MAKRDILIEENLEVAALTGAPVKLPQKLASIFPALSLRNYQLYFAGHLVSIIGFWIQQVGIGWYVLQLTGSAFWVGTVPALGGLPLLLVTPFTGVLIDKINKQKLIVVTQTFETAIAFIFGLLVFSGRANLPVVIILSVANGLVHSFDLPTRQAFMIEMVGKNVLASAVSLNNSLFNAARFIGPAMAGVLIAGFGVGWTFIINATSFLPGIWAIVKIRPLYQHKAEVDIHPWQSFKNGLAFTFGHRRIFYLMVLASATAIFMWPYQTLMPVVAENFYHSGPRGLGTLLAAAGLGSLFGAIFVSSQSDRQDKDRLSLVGLLTASLAFILFSVNSNFLLAHLLLFIGGFGLLTQVVTTNTLVQLLAPDAMRGRVIAVYLTMFVGMMPAGNALAGLAAQYTSAPFTIGAGALIFLLFGLFLYFRGTFSNFVVK